MIDMLDNYQDVLKVNELMEILRIGRNTAYEYLQSGEIPCKKIRNKYIIPKAGVENYLKQIT